MKNIQLALILVIVLICSALYSGSLILRYMGASRRIQNLQPRLNENAQKEKVLDSLIAETIEYSKTHPAINGLLQSALAPSAAPAKTPAK